MLALVSLLATGMVSAGMEEMEFRAVYTGAGGTKPGPTPQICVDGAPSCGSDPDAVPSCDFIIGDGSLIGNFEGEVFACINPETGAFFNAYYEIRGARGSFYGPFEIVEAVPTFAGGDLTQPPTALATRGEWTVDGGTGIFRNAKSGFNTALGLQSTTSGVLPLIVLEGTIEIEQDGQGEQ